MRTLLFGLASVVTTLVHAAPQGMTLKDLYNTALQQIETVELQNIQVSLAKERQGQLNSTFYPQIAMSAIYTRQDVPSTEASSSPVAAFFDPNQLVSKLSATTYNFSGLKEAAAFKAAKADTRAQQALLEQAKLSLYAQVAQAYYAVLASRKDLEHAQMLQRLAGKRLNEIQHFVKVGRSQEGDYLAQKTQVAIYETGVIQAERTLQSATDILAMTTGISPHEAIADDMREPESVTNPIEFYLDRIDSRPDIKSLQEKTEFARHSVTIAKAGHLPTLSLNANYYLARTGILHGSMWDAGFNFNFPIFEGFNVNSRVRQAESNLRSQRYLYLQGRRAAEKDIRIAFNNLKLNIDPLPAIKRAIEAAQEGYKRRVLDYKHKLTTNLDVNQAETQLFNVLRTYDYSFYQAKAAQEVLLASTGNIL